MSGVAELHRKPGNEKYRSCKEEDDKLAKRAKNGDMAAREELILNHLSLVRTMLSEYSGRGVPDDVLFQEGCYGLILAADRYDPNNRASLSTYASFYINKYMFEAVQDSMPRPMMLKQKAAKKAKLYKDAVEKLADQLGRTPSNQEIADHLGISYEEAMHLMDATAQIVYYDDPEVNESILGCGHSRPAEEEVIDRLNEMVLDDFPVSLTKRELQVLTLRFGFGPEAKPYTFLEIGKKLGISNELASEICQRALKKLQSSKIVQK